jgi:stage III sporulation protein SpoIIIAA
VVLVGTAHGIELGGLLKNPDLVRLVGGVTAVTLGDAEAAANNNGKKVSDDECLPGVDTTCTCC